MADSDPAGPAPPWHALAPGDALARLDSRESGLTEDEARDRLARVGLNALPTPRPPGVFVVFLRQFRSPLIYLLLAAAAVSVAIGDVSDGGFIFAVLLINATVGSIQEWKAQSSAEALKHVIATAAVVRRAGGHEAVPSETLVPGDIVQLESGARVPADLRLIDTHEALADEALLTGESTAVIKQEDAALAPDTPLAERRTMMHAGTTMLSGRATGVVVATGMATAVGCIAEALVFRPPTPPPLMERLEQMTRAIGIAVIVAVVALGAAAFAHGGGLVEVFMVAVALAVSAIPEGLPVAITIALATATARMARRGVIVRLLPAVEGLGACTMIATDKTGTLTCNELTAKRILLPGHGAFAVSGEGYRFEGRLETLAPGSDRSRSGAGFKPAPDSVMESARRLAQAGTLCNEATLRRDDDRVVRFGDTVDVAFLVLGVKLGVDRAALLERCPEVGVIPFESARRFAASFNRVDGRVVAHVKGAAETVIPMCRAIDHDSLLREAARLAGDGYRVLAVAAGPVADEAPFAPESLQALDLLGLVGLIDPVRPEVPEAIRRCHRAGVAVAMVTGDHPATALAIARELGLIGGEAAAEHGAEWPDDVITGADLARLEGDGYAAAVARARVFARVEPAQKTAIVETMMAAGHFVAVTGDGVNDAPALHAANIGVAMGRDGTDIARGAADLILTDDNFASIVNGIEEGRIAYANVRKLVYMAVSTGAAEIMLFALAVPLGLPIPLFAVQLLWLNLVTNGIQDVALAFERGEPGILDRPPRPPRQPIFDARMIEQCVLSGGFMGVASFVFFAICLRLGWAEEAARNAVLLMMVLFENVHIFNCRSETRSAFRVPVSANRFVVMAAIAAQAIHIAAMNLPGISDVLHVGPVEPLTYAVVFVIALALVGIMELYKRLRFGGTAAPA